MGKSYHEHRHPHATSGGIGFIGALLILFIALKLTHHIDWSWFWVLAPGWAPVALLLGVFLVLLTQMLIHDYLSARRRRKAKLTFVDVRYDIRGVQKRDVQ